MMFSKILISLSAVDMAENVMSGMVLFSQFDVSRVLTCGASLLGSEGNQYDVAQTAIGNYYQYPLFSFYICDISECLYTCIAFLRWGVKCFKIYICVSLKIIVSR